MSTSCHFPQRSDPRAHEACQIRSMVIGMKCWPSGRNGGSLQADKQHLVGRLLLRRQVGRIEPGSAQLCLSGSSRPGIATSADRTPRRCARLAHSWNGRPGEGRETRPLHRPPKPRGPAALGAVAERVAENLLAGAVAPAALTAVGCRPSSRPAACAAVGVSSVIAVATPPGGGCLYGRQPRDRVDPHRRISSLTWSSTTGRIIRAAPSLHWAVGQHVMELRRHCRRMGWKVRAATGRQLRGD